MEKKKIIFLINHFQKADGTARALIGVVNSLDLNKFDVTIKPLYICDESLKCELNSGIKLEKCFGFYFRGFAKIAKKLPLKYLYKKFINYKYDIEVAFQCDLSTILVGNSFNKDAVHIAWMHGYELQPNEYTKCDKVICVSKYCADKATKEMNNKVHFEYKYNLVDDNIIKKMSEEAIDIDLPSETIFVSVGRHSPEKGYVRLVKILSELRDEGFKFKCILVGDGPDHVNIVNEIKKYNMENEIILTGSDVNPHKYTAKSDVFICSSFKEGYSTACTEAAILGIPVITTSVPGAEEIINDCECGLITNLDDDSLKSGIRKVLENPTLIEDWKNVLKNTKFKFGYELRKKEMDKLFEEIYNISNNR